MKVELEEVYDLGAEHHQWQLLLLASNLRGTRNEFQLVVVLLLIVILVVIVVIVAAQGSRADNLGWWGEVGILRTTYYLLLTT